MNKSHASAAQLGSTPSRFDERTTDKQRMDTRATGNRPIRMLRLAQVIDATGLGKTTIYELQAEGTFPKRVKITSHSVGWVEAEVQAWLSSRINDL
jgi:prophage regulatory protein